MLVDGRSPGLRSLTLEEASHGGYEAHLYSPAASLAPRRQGDDAASGPQAGTEASPRIRTIRKITSFTPDGKLVACTFNPQCGAEAAADPSEHLVLAPFPPELEPAGPTHAQEPPPPSRWDDDAQAAPLRQERLLEDDDLGPTDMDTDGIRRTMLRELSQLSFKGVPLLRPSAVPPPTATRASVAPSTDDAAVCEEQEPEGSPPPAERSPHAQVRFDEGHKGDANHLVLMYVHSLL
jgi:hypothetical protein